MADTDIKITEILYDAPDAGIDDNDHEWVEITNTGTSNVALNGWTLDDSISGGTIGTLPDVTLLPDEVAVLYNSDLTEEAFLAVYGPVPPGTVLIPVDHWQPLNNSGGDTVNLVSDDAVLVSSVTYPDDAAPGESLHYDPAGNYLGAGTPTPGIACFTNGTMVRTSRGETLIDTLKAGDLVLTKDHGFQPIRWIGQRLVSPQALKAHPEYRPVLFQKSALEPGVPARDTRVSQQHRILLESTLSTLLFGEPRMLAAARNLIEMPGISIEQATKPVTYFHILFDRHEVIFADGLASESFNPVVDGLNNLESATRHEILALFPELSQKTSPLAYPQLSPAEAALLTG